MLRIPRSKTHRRRSYLASFCRFLPKLGFAWPCPRCCYSAWVRDAIKRKDETSKAVSTDTRTNQCLAKPFAVQCSRNSYAIAQALLDTDPVESKFFSLSGFSSPAEKAPGLFHLPWMLFWSDRSSGCWADMSHNWTLCWLSCTSATWVPSSLRSYFRL